MQASSSMSLDLSAFGRRLLDRRDFLSYSATGLGSLALATLLGEDKLLAGDGGPIRPRIRSEAPLAVRPPHFTAKANRVLMIFCSGAVSHLDIFDYKPELVRRDGQAMPDAPVTFQGEQGNLAQPRWR